MTYLHLFDLFSIEDFEKDIEEGYIKVQSHPTLPLKIANYTDKTAYERKWRDTTLRSRGLIYEEFSLRVIATGPAKFFNYGESSGPELSLDALCVPTIKHDGSLGIAYRYGGHYGIATRGSFASEQAVHASAHIDEDLQTFIDSGVDLGLTRIFEIIYPDNRIVLDYGDRDELIPLGSVNNANGVIASRPLEDWLISMTSLDKVIALPIADDEEGFVVDIIDPDTFEVLHHVKLKGDRYKELHGAIFGLNERKVWEAFCEEDEDRFIEQLPDELHGWATSVVQRLKEEYYAHFGEIVAAFDSFPEFESRRDAAQWIMGNHKELSSPLFLALDGNWDRVSGWVNDKIRPAHVPFKTVPEFA
jgi:RNA ligase